MRFLTKTSLLAGLSLGLLTDNRIKQDPQRFFDTKIYFSADTAYYNFRAIDLHNALLETQANGQLKMPAFRTVCNEAFQRMIQEDSPIEAFSITGRLDQSLTCDGPFSYDIVDHHKTDSTHYEDRNTYHRKELCNINVPAALENMRMIGQKAQDLYDERKYTEDEAHLPTGIFTAYKNNKSGLSVLVYRPPIGNAPQ